MLHITNQVQIQRAFLDFAVMDVTVKSEYTENNWVKAMRVLII